MVRRVAEALDQVRSTAPPQGIDRLEDSREALTGWVHVAAEPETFLALEFCSASWLEHALPALLEAEKSAVLAGDQLLHFDVRSDNICFAGDRTLLVDWNHACVGNARVVLVGWVPSFFRVM